MMHHKSVLLIALLPFFTSAIPAPGNVNVPITDAEWSALQAGGLARRSPATVNQPITDSEWEALEAGGLSKRANDIAFAKRDSVMNCGHLVTGKGGSNGHGKWIPVAQFSDLANQFCGAYTGTDIYKGHQTSDTYPITMTNQKNDNLPGPPGNIVFAIYNTKRSDTYQVDHDTCLRAMKAPLGDHVHKRDGHVQLLGKRDDCWGHKHNDYEGGYYEVNNIGAFGSEVYAV